MKINRFAMLILEISEFLANRPPADTTVTRPEARMLELGSELLRRVVEGHEVSTAANHLIPNYYSLHAYSFAQRAMQSGYANNNLWDDVIILDKFKKAWNLLEDLRSGGALCNQEPAVVDEAILLFKRLAKYAFLGYGERYEPSNIGTQRGMRNNYYYLL